MAARTHIEIVTATGVPVELALAGPGARSFAFATDLLLRFLLASSWFLVVRLLADLASNVPRTVNTVTLYAGTLPAALIYLGYHPLFEILWAGRTPGKRVAGVRLVDGQGRPPSVTAVLVRTVFRLVDSIPVAYAVGLVSCLVTAHAQRLGDLAAGTLLVYAQDSIDAAQFDDRVLSASLAPRIAVARELLERWPTLDPAYRRRLAHKLIGLDGEVDANDEALLTQRLGEIIDART